MIKRMLTRAVLSLGLMAVAIFASACTGSTAEPATLAPDGAPAHERHATGIDSQVGDN